METLNETTWDVLICGTGLQQSLLALALSRSTQKVLHVDRNGFYGGSDAALSLQEVGEWIKHVQAGKSSDFQNASVSVPAAGGTCNADPKAKLSFSRAYSLSLSPQIIYTRSALLKTLVTSKVYHQLEFLSIGRWWIYAPPSTTAKTQDLAGTLKRVPNGREDVFSDDSIDLRSKRVLMHFLRFVADFENQPEKWRPWALKPVSEFLASEFRIPEALQSPLIAISMSPDMPDRTTVAYALPQIAQHLRSAGVFGPGFGAIIPRWGGNGEICQVACRAGAVGGGVYVLGRGVASIVPSLPTQEGQQLHEVELTGGERVKARFVVGTADDLPLVPDLSLAIPNERVNYHSVSVVSSTLAALLPITAEGAPTPAGAVVVFPTGSLELGDGKKFADPPVYVVLHSSDTGECPSGQSVLYASISVPASSPATAITNEKLLYNAVDLLLSAAPLEPTRPKILYAFNYSRSSRISSCPVSPQTIREKGILLFPPSSTPSPILDEGIIERVKSLWEQIRKPAVIGTEITEGTQVMEEEFMSFDEREGYNPADEDNIS